MTERADTVLIKVTLRHDHETIAAVDVCQYYVFRACVCRLNYPTCNGNAPYCHLGPVRLYHISSHKRHDLRTKDILNIKSVLIFCTTLV